MSAAVAHLTNLSIRNKIIGAFLSLMIMIAAVGGTAIQKFAALNGSVEEITTNYLLGVEYLSGMRGSILHYRITLTKGLLHTPDAGNGDSLDKSLTQWITALAAQEAKYAPTITEPEERAIYVRYQDAWKPYLEAAQRTLALWHTGKQQEAVDYYVIQAAPKGEQVDTTLNEDIQYNVAQGKTWADRAAEDYSGGRFVVLLLLAVAVAGFAGYICIRGIATPIQAI